MKRHNDDSNDINSNNHYNDNKNDYNDGDEDEDLMITMVIMKTRMIKNDMSTNCSSKICMLMIMEMIGEGKAEYIIFVLYVAKSPKNV